MLRRTENQYDDSTGQRVSNQHGRDIDEVPRYEVFKFDRPNGRLLAMSVKEGVSGDNGFPTPRKKLSVPSASVRTGQFGSRVPEDARFSTGT
ncbi:hypothetical protein FRX31_033550 [Thalictrum thalictroides]|uniref:Uncharacterized protein n=1 Tax=Thalictrum thalictroides TaxID=46969 RepID=A0A7J6UXF3_THATH|nr:hypothetical protein FRX31_033550 [Thalictrum thalictroides]